MHQRTRHAEINVRMLLHKLQDGIDSLKTDARVGPRFSQLRRLIFKVIYRADLLKLSMISCWVIRQSLDYVRAG